MLDRVSERRTVLVALAGASLGLCAGQGWLGLARPRAATREATLQDAAVPGSLPRRTWFSPANCYFAYPHNNGFLPGSGLPVVAQRGGPSVTFSEWDFRRGTLRPIVRTGVSNTYYDVAEATGDLFFVEDQFRIRSVSTRAGSADKRDVPLHLEAPERIEDLLSVNHAGDRVLYALERPAPDQRAILSARFLELDLTRGGTAPVCDVPFNADHQQYCPHDERWVGFAHEGDISGTHDRVWGIYRAGNDRQPHRLWDEKAETGPLLAGHERWAFHRTGALVVAYPSSEGRPRGLYFVDPVARRVDLVSASEYDWHCNISRSGPLGGGGHYPGTWTRGASRMVASSPTSC